MLPLTPPILPDEFSTRLRERIAVLPRTLRRVAHYFAHHPLDVISHSASELAAALGTSDATIVRAAQALGYKGLSDLKRSLATALSTAGPAARFRHTLGSADARQVCDRLLAAQAKKVVELSDPASQTAIAALAARLDAARRIVLFGLGPTAHIAAYGAQILRRHGRQAQLLRASGAGLADEILDLQAGDGLLLFSYSPAQGEVFAVLGEARRLEIPIILVTDSANSALARQADQVAIVPRGETRGVALHGVTLIWLEALLVTLSALRPPQTQASLDRLERTRQTIAQPPDPRGPRSG